jgi:hypothetical protein
MNLANINMQITLKDFQRFWRGSEHCSLGFAPLLAPFGIHLPEVVPSRSGVLVGLLLDDLSMGFSKMDLIDPMDIAMAAYSLGEDDAGVFLENGTDAIASILSRP